MVAVIIKHYFILNNPVEAASVITVLIKSNESDIRLFVFGIFIEDDEYHSFLKRVIEKILHFSKLFRCVICCELCQISSIRIKIAIKIVESVVLPVEIGVLNFVFAKRHLKAIIEPVSYTHLRAHETRHDLVCRLLLEKKK